MLRSLIILVLTLFPSLLFSQVMQGPQEERLVRLIDAKSVEKTTDLYGREYRKVTGPAQFLHNNALIICDTAIWDVLLNTVDAIGNVKIIQNQTTLLSDNIKYVADRSVAEVRGKLVEMVDKDDNRLRTHYLDYYTKDSIGMFYNGGSMVGKDGSIIESLNGFYYGKQHRFLFQVDVQMDADSVLVRADSLAYQADQKRAIFLSKTYAWENDGFLFAKGGWYDRTKELFHFTNDAYIKTRDNEIWADTIYYNKNKAEAELFNNIQILDTAQSALVFADYAKYRQKPFNVLLTNKPSIASYTVEDGVADTLFFAADTIRYYAFPKNEIDSSTIAQSAYRYAQSKKDALEEILKRKAQEAKPEKRAVPPTLPTPPIKDTLVPAKKRHRDKSGKAKSDATLNLNIKDTLDTKDTLKAKTLLVKATDSLKVTAPDSVATKDTIVPIVDTTSIKFLLANKNIRIFKSNMQCICDSLMSNSLDSLIRLYKDPVIWTDKNQLTSDSVQVVITNKTLSKAELNSSAFVVMPEDSTHFDQIKSADVVAFFKDGELRRFDAFGGVSILFFFSEDSVLTTMNEKECKAMSAGFREGQKLDRVRYFEGVSSNAYPLYKLEQEKQKLKGFRWMDDKRPKNRFDVSDRTIKPSQTSLPESIEKPAFMQTEIYFGKKTVRPKKEVNRIEPENKIQTPEKKIEAPVKALKKSGQPFDLTVSRKPEGYK